jgi:hypothetical protein
VHDPLFGDYEMKTRDEILTTTTTTQTLPNGSTVVTVREHYETPDERGITWSSIAHFAGMALIVCGLAYMALVVIPNAMRPKETCIGLPGIETPIGYHAKMCKKM